MPAATPLVDLQAENARLNAENMALMAQLADLQQQFAWFKRNLFGERSEKRNATAIPEQPDLFAVSHPAGETAAKTDPPQAAEVEAQAPRRKKRQPQDVTDSGLRFDADVPVEVIHLPPRNIDDIPEHERQVVTEKISYRLAQRPASTVVLKYVRPVIKRRGTDVLHCAPAPANVLEGSLAEVSFLAGMLIDKFCYHLPLYRQHQRLAAAGVTISRSTLTNLAGRAIDLLAPIVEAQHQHLLRGDLIAMDETPIKAGRKGKDQGKLKRAWMWPMMGPQQEVVFHYAASRAQDEVTRLLGTDFAGTLLTDGYAAYTQYVKQLDAVTLANCWAHSRRYFERALEAEPVAANAALDFIGQMYHQEACIREQALTLEAIQKHRTAHTEPIVKAFWQWCDEQQQRTDLLPKNPLSKALKYVRARRAELMVFLANAQVPIDTNHLERALRPIPLGRKNWMFCWTELGAERLGIIQSLMVTCQLQAVDPYHYLVDVLQRVDRHPAADVHQLMPRVWKTMFAQRPLRSHLG